MAAPTVKSAIIIGASSGIGRAMAVVLSRDGYRVGVVARRTDLLDQLRAELTGPCVISSIAALRGIGGAPAYAASKAFVSNYLQGVRYRFNKLKLPIVVTDVQPGFVDTRMAQADRVFWVASPETAARQIVAAIRGRRRHVYVTRRWRLIAWLLRVVPDALYSKL